MMLLVNFPAVNFKEEKSGRENFTANCSFFPSQRHFVNNIESGILSVNAIEQRSAGNNLIKGNSQRLS